MNQVEIGLNQLTSIVWSEATILVIFLSGIFFSLYLRIPQFSLFISSIKLLFKNSSKDRKSGEISQFQALCASMSSSVGIGNIAGVAVAISMAGPGAIFWMWVTGILGMASQLVSVCLTMMYRNKVNSEFKGGPMYTIKNGLSKRFSIFSYLYALFVCFSSAGTGMFQANQMASFAHLQFGIDQRISGLLITILAGLVVYGGIKRIGAFTEKFVPFMVLTYFFACFGIMLHHYESFLPSLGLIFNHAFTGSAAVGGFAGANVKYAIIQGVKRASYSNGATMGDLGLVHASAKSEPVAQSLISMLGPFIDTLVVCSITALIILQTGVWTEASGMQGIELTTKAFVKVYGHFGPWVLFVVIAFFAYSTMISYCHIGETGFGFLFGDKKSGLYRVTYLASLFLGSTLVLNLVLNVMDICYVMLIIPNLLACFILCKKVKTLLELTVAKQTNKDAQTIVSLGIINSKK